MIFGAHVIVYSTDATADRAFLREVLGLSAVDAGHGWLIFALPPAEVAVHPAEENGRHELSFMCDDLKAEILALDRKASAVRKCKKQGGDRSPTSRFRAEVKSVSTSRSIQWR